MKKTIAAVAAGVLLIAAQSAIAQSSTAAPQVGDRLGAVSGEADEFGGGASIFGIIAAAGVIAAIVSVATTDDDSESD